MASIPDARWKMLEGRQSHTCGASVEGSTDGELSTMDITYATPAAAPAGSATCQPSEVGLGG